MDSSQAQIMFGHRMRTLLPISNQRLQPETRKGDAKLLQRKEVQSKYFNRGSKEFTELKRDDVVPIQPSKQDHTGNWKKGKVIKKAGMRSYIVETEDGRAIRRNRRFLRTSKENFIDINEDLPYSPSQNNEEIRPNNVNYEREINAETQIESEEQEDKSDAVQSNATTERDRNNEDYRYDHRQ
eukprot:gene8299-9183_t